MAVGYEEAEALAYEQLGLEPRQLSRLTPAELVAMAVGRQRRDEREMWRLAWLVARVTAATGMLKQAPRVSDLMQELVGEDRMAQILSEEMRRHRREG